MHEVDDTLFPLLPTIANSIFFHHVKFDRVSIKFIKNLLKILSTTNSKVILLTP